MLRLPFQPGQNEMEPEEHVSCWHYLETLPRCIRSVSYRR